jgi:hypothetical protein
MTAQGHNVEINQASQPFINHVLNRDGKSLALTGANAFAGRALHRGFSSLP